MISRRQMLSGLVIGLLAVSVDAQAQDRPKPAARGGADVVPAEFTETSREVQGPVHIEVRCVRATNKNDRVDLDLKDLEKRLGHLKYTGFTLIDEHSDDLDPGEEASFSIVGERRVRVELISRDEKEAKVRIRMQKNGQSVMDTTVRIHRNRQFIVAGPKMGDDVLVLPVSVRY